MDGYHVLVIILAVVLAIFLILAIIATILFIKILRSTKKITRQAESFVNDMESLSSTFRNVAIPAAFIKIFTNVFKTVRRSKK
ncbi:MAG TPA: hypothetical protein VMR51_01740 [Patescibacteria group bacterium]|jgi:biopolymer transport protein ExbB/TolQ|nr:hypothetical protein [Patescibacteria group bacterium]